MNSISPFFRRSLIAALLVLGAVSSRAASFEGRLEMKMTEARDRGDDDGNAAERTQTILYSMKGNKARVDMTMNAKEDHPGQPKNAAMIMDFDSHEMLMLTEMPDREGGAPKKVFFRHTLHTGDLQKNSEHMDDTVSVVATGRTDSILGYRAEEYKITEKDGTVSEAWLAKGLGAFLYPKAQNPMASRRGSEPPSAWEKLGQEGLFPLRAISRDKKGREKSRMEVTKIDKVSIPDSTFTTEGYTEFQMPNFGDMMKGAASDSANNAADQQKSSIKDRLKGGFDRLKALGR